MYIYYKKYAFHEIDVHNAVKHVGNALLEKKKPGVIAQCEYEPLMLEMDWLDL